MNFTVQQLQLEKVTADAVVVLVPQSEESFWDGSAELKKIAEAASPVLSSGDFTGARDTSAVAYTSWKKLPRIILVGYGETGQVSLEKLRRAGALAIQRATGLKCKTLAVVQPAIGSFTPADVAQAISEGLALGVYSYDKHISQKPNGGFSAPNKVVLLGLDAAEVKGMKVGAATGKAVSDGVLLARDLANAPSNEIDPQTLAARAKELSSVGVKVTVLTKAQIEKLGMGGLVAVNKGSEIPPSFIIMEWKGGGRNEQPLVFVGKGVTFDSGGILIKPGAGMADMKLDMGGAAAVIGAMHTIATLKLKQNVIGLVAATENMPSGTAFKPGDVIKHLNGKTSEIDNTDAEGRLILADALAYADRYKPQAVIDLATLTGACVVALGNVASGLMGNTPELNNRIRQSGDRTYDRVVELPLWEEYEELIKSDVADVKNSGGRGAGTITAGLFLKTFIGNYPWAHIDIAGTGMTSRPSGYINKGGTGAGVRLLVDFVQNWTSL